MSSSSSSSDSISPIHLIDDIGTFCASIDALKKAAQHVSGIGSSTPIVPSSSDHSLSSPDSSSSPSPSFSSSTPSLPSIPRYNIVGIMGCQSTGKSTLLNHLFGSRFEMMDSSRGRQQTTKGIWVDYDRHEKNGIIAMDLEGTDSGERGEDRTTFERQTSLYALALAEVLIINLWEHDIGRYTASNFGILKTIFEVDLELFASDGASKTILLFVIRDYYDGPGSTSLDSLKNKIQTDIDKVWIELNKPSKFINSPLSDFFELRFITLPDYRRNKDDFLQQIQLFRQWFFSPSSTNYLFQSIPPKSVPADGFGKYCEQIWSTIKDNKYLNLPSQKEMLATFRCEEIAADIITQLELDIEGMKKIIDALNYNQNNSNNNNDDDNHKEGEERKTEEEEEGEEEDTNNKKNTISSVYLSSFQSDVRLKREKAIAAFMEQTSHYYGDIVKKKKLELINKINELFYPLFIQQLQSIINIIFNNFKQNILAELPSADDELCENFQSIASNATKQAKLSLETELSKLNVKECDWPYESRISDYYSRQSEWLLNERNKQLLKLGRVLSRAATQLIDNDLTRLLKSADNNLWIMIAILHNKIYDQLINDLLDILKNYDATEKEIKDAKKKAKNVLGEVIKNRIKSQLINIESVVRDRFTNLFTRDENDLPRRWQGGENIRLLFDNARRSALSLIDLFAEFRLSLELEKLENDGKGITTGEGTEGGEIPSLQRQKSLSSSSKSKIEILLSSDDRELLREKLRRDFDPLLMQAEETQARNNQFGKLSLLGVAFIIYMASDWIFFLLRSPIYLFSTIAIIGGAFYLLYQNSQYRPLFNTVWTMASLFIITPATAIFNQTTAGQNLPPALTRLPSMNVNGNPIPTPAVAASAPSTKNTKSD